MEEELVFFQSLLACLSNGKTINDGNFIEVIIYNKDGVYPVFTIDYNPKFKPTKNLNSYFG